MSRKEKHNRIILLFIMVAVTAILCISAATEGNENTGISQICNNGTDASDSSAISDSSATSDSTATSETAIATNTTVIPGTTGITNSTVTTNSTETTDIIVGDANRTSICNIPPVEVFVTEPTCTSTGIAKRVCSECGFESVPYVVEALGHDWPDIWEMYNENKHAHFCLRCKETAEYADHTFNREAADSRYLMKPATCIAAAVYYKSCACGAYSTSATFTSGELGGHTEVIDMAVDPTCTETGLTEGKHCSVCETVLVKQKEIPAKGHTLRKSYYEATCTKYGYVVSACSVCGKEETRYDVMPRGHVSVTANIYGNVYSVCTVCGFSDELAMMPVRNATFSPEDPAAQQRAFFAAPENGEPWMYLFAFFAQQDPGQVEDGEKTTVILPMDENCPLPEPAGQLKLLRITETEPYPETAFDIRDGVLSFEAEACGLYILTEVSDAE